MTVNEYLKLKYSNIKSTSLLANEAKIFNIPYPLKSGWLKIHGDTIITDNMSKSLRKYFHFNSHQLHAIKVIKFLGGELTPEEYIPQQSIPQDKVALDAIKKENDYIKKVYGTKKIYKQVIAASKLKELWR